MKTYSIYQIDAFTQGPFTGNPAAVCPLEKWLPDELMQKIAEENNLSETAFFVPENTGFKIRWFTPAIEVKLCGHATLATAHVLFHELGFKGEKIHFTSLSGELRVRRKKELLELDFPTDKLKKIAIPKYLEGALGRSPVEVYEGREDLLVVFEHANDVVKMKPDFTKLKTFDVRGTIATAPGIEGFDFISRGFFPQAGIDEDPATGSAHTTLTPYWAKRLDKKSLTACQWSARKGYFNCELKANRTLISGKTHRFLKGEITI